MKTDKQLSKGERHGRPGGIQSHKQSGKHGPKRKKSSFFLDVPESDKKGQPKRAGGRGPAGASGAAKRGPGVQRTTAFKPKQQAHGGVRGHGHGDKKKHNPSGPPQKGGRPQEAGSRQKGDQRQNGGPHQKDQHRTPPVTFQGKPGKVSYCMAPDRLEAQAAAVKQLAREERERQFEERKEKRNQQHKMMTQKTRKGQPVMQGRMELLLEKIKKSMGVQ